RPRPCSAEGEASTGQLPAACACRWARQARHPTAPAPFPSPFARALELAPPPVSVAGCTPAPSPVWLVGGGRGTPRSAARRILHPTHPRAPARCARYAHRGLHGRG